MFRRRFLPDSRQLQLPLWGGPGVPGPNAPGRNAPLPSGYDPALEAKARELAARAGCGVLAQCVRVTWNAKLQSTAGQARFDLPHIILNPLLITISEAEVDRTLRHELAHLVARERHSKRRIPPHGREWRRACADLGIPGEEARHQLPLPRRQIRPRHHYRCPNCGNQIARVHPLRRKEACLPCCKTLAGGRYDARFRFVEVAEESAG